MDSKHWDWGKGYCRRHLGNGLPCQVCITRNDPDLERTREEWAALIDENPCKEVVGECSVGATIKGSGPSVQNLPKADFRIEPSQRIKGIFVSESYDGDGNLTERVTNESTVSNEGFEKMLDIDFSKWVTPSQFLDPTTGLWHSTEGAIDLLPRRADLPNVADCDQPVIHEPRLKEPITLQNGDSLLVRYTVEIGDPKIETETRVLPLAERLQLVADQHRQRFFDTGVEDPDDLLKLLGTEKLLQPKIEGFELPKRLPLRVPLDMELIGTIIEAEGCSDELRAALMSQIEIYGVSRTIEMLAKAGLDERFIESLKSNLSER